MLFHATVLFQKAACDAFFSTGTRLSEGDRRVEETLSAIEEAVPCIVGGQVAYREWRVSPMVITQENGKLTLIDARPYYAIKPHHVYPLALQSWILTQLGHPVHRCELIHLNKQGFSDSKGQLHDLFKREDVTQLVAGLKGRVGEKKRQIRETLSRDTPPPVHFHFHCDRPAACPYKKDCWPHHASEQIQILKDFTLKEKYRYLNKRGWSLSVLPAIPNLSEEQTRLLDHELGNHPFVQEELLKAFLKTIQAPMACLDFEAFQSPIPVHPNMKPFQQVPFTMAITLIDESGSLTNHIVFTEGAEDPHAVLAEALVEFVPEDVKTVLVFDRRLEDQLLSKLMDATSESIAQKIAEIQSKIVDLRDPFENDWLYAPGMFGRFSLKAIYQALTKGSLYSDLKVQEGLDASEGYLRLLVEEDPEVRAAIKADLEAYALADTQAIAALLEGVRGVCT